MYNFNGVPSWLSGKESACSTGDTGLIPWLGRSPEGGNGSPLQYSCLENSMERGAWWATVHGVTKSWKQLQTYMIININYRLYETDFIMQFILWYNFNNSITSSQKALFLEVGGRAYRGSLQASPMPHLWTHHVSKMRTSSRHTYGAAIQKLSIRNCGTLRNWKSLLFPITHPTDTKEKTQRYVSQQICSPAGTTPQPIALSVRREMRTEGPAAASHFCLFISWISLYLEPCEFWTLPFPCVRLRWPWVKLFSSRGEQDRRHQGRV